MKLDQGYDFDGKIINNFNKKVSAWLDSEDKMNESNHYKRFKLVDELVSK